jgi:hypothetical protein
MFIRLNDFSAGGDRNPILRKSEGQETLQEIG